MAYLQSFAESKFPIRNPPEQSPKMSSEPSLEDAHKTLYAAGHKLRCEVTGEARVAKTLEANSSDFSRPMQDFVTEAGWGMIWSRPGLERKTRSLLNIAMLCALNRGTELGVHVRGALNNGASELEIREVLIQVAGYVGMPAGLEGTRIAERVINEVKAEKEGKS